MSSTKFSQLTGKDVISQDGRDIGDVADLVFDTESWTIETIVVKLGRELLEQFHMKKPLIGTQTIQIPTSYVSGVGDRVILHKTLSDLTALAREEIAREAAKHVRPPGAPPEHQ
jgi:sporulation protein YlmC with PRC-barrel domain